MWTIQLSSDEIDQLMKEYTASSSIHSDGLDQVAFARLTKDFTAALGPPACDGPALFGSSAETGSFIETELSRCSTLASDNILEAAEAVEGDVQVLLAFYHVHEQSYATRHKVEKVLRAYQRKARKKASKDGVECDWRDLMYAAIASQRGEDPRVHWERAASDGVVAATGTTSDDSRQHHRTSDLRTARARPPRTQPPRRPRTRRAHVTRR
jgi:hypothetical protein